MPDLTLEEMARKIVDDKKSAWYPWIESLGHTPIQAHVLIEEVLVGLIKDALSTVFRRGWQAGRQGCVQAIRELHQHGVSCEYIVRLLSSLPVPDQEGHDESPRTL